MKKIKMVLLIVLLCVSASLFTDDVSNSEVWHEWDDYLKFHILSSMMAGIACQWQIINDVILPLLSDEDNREVSTVLVSILDTNWKSYKVIDAKPTDYWLSRMDAMYYDPKYENENILQVFTDLLMDEIGE